MISGSGCGDVDGDEKMNAFASVPITPILVADLSVEGERMPVYVHVIDHPDARILVDTGWIEAGIEFGRRRMQLRHGESRTSVSAYRRWRASSASGRGQPASLIVVRPRTCARIGQ